MSHDTGPTVIDAYYEALGAGRGAFSLDQLRTILAPELDFEGPLAGRVVGAEPFIEGVSGFAGTMSRLTMLHRVHHLDQAATLYDAMLPGGPIRFAEFFRIANGRISSLRLLYDGGAYLAQGGR